MEEDVQPKVVFQGLTALASLTHAVVGKEPLDVSHVFQGLTALASLKLGTSWLGSLLLSRFPGLNRPGLIEASPASRKLTGGTISFPGLNRPGLIEAILYYLQIEYI